MSILGKSADCGEDGTGIVLHDDGDHVFVMLRPPGCRVSVVRREDLLPLPRFDKRAILPDMITTPEFTGFPKMARLSREVVLTEKIDGTNASVLITEDGDLFFGSRTRWITPSADNHGFARWAEGNKESLLRLGPGRHHGEWFGCGINRGYGLKEKRFALFNTLRWHQRGAEPRVILSADPRIEPKTTTEAPDCCHVVPVLWRGVFNTAMIEGALTLLGAIGSVAAPGFMDPEGIVVFHVSGNVAFKKTLGDDGAKGGKP